MAWSDAARAAALEARRRHSGLKPATNPKTGQVSVAATLRAAGAPKHLQSYNLGPGRRSVVVSAYEKTQETRAQIAKMLKGLRARGMDVRSSRTNYGPKSQRQYRRYVVAVPKGGK